MGSGVTQRAMALQRTTDGPPRMSRFGPQKLVRRGLPIKPIYGLGVDLLRCAPPVPSVPAVTSIPAGSQRDDVPSGLCRGSGFHPTRCEAVFGQKNSALLGALPYIYNMEAIATEGKQAKNGGI